MRIRRVCLAVLIFSLMFPALSMAVTYNGYLSSATPDSGLVIATGVWGTNPDNIPTTIEWWVTQEGQIWHYEYHLTAYKGEFSHMILETSLNFGTLENDLFNVTVNGNTGYDSYSIVEWGSASSNPNIPGSLYGIKFDEVSDTDLTISFDSRRQPMWGDFYAKDGTAGGLGDNTCWNAGFATGEQAGLAGNDPTVDASDGTIDHHILVPDTKTTPPVPEAGTMVMAGIGMTTMFSGLRFARKLRRVK